MKYGWVVVRLRLDNRLSSERIWGMGFWECRTTSVVELSGCGSCEFDY